MATLPFRFVFAFEFGRGSSCLVKVVVSYVADNATNQMVLVATVRKAASIGKRGEEKASGFVLAGRVGVFGSHWSGRLLVARSNAR